MANEPNPVDQAVSRALRENLERILRLTEEVQLAISDVASACASPKPAGALPPMMRAQTAAASLAASLEILSRFVTTALQPMQRTAAEEAAAAEMSLPAAGAKPAPVRAAVPAPAAAPPVAAKPAVAPRPAPPPPPPPPVVADPEPEPVVEEEVLEMNVEEAAGVEEEFDVSRLSAEEQEMHRRANRVAKVSMQDIKMLKPEQVKLGRQNKDICVRLRDDIEKAHKEYERRFRQILTHPVDYFYHWLVQILADGDAEAIGDYPYAS
ncbi:MAG: hypothetical protein LAN71_15595 [Acidobacteriia bacterium]|nr:hypothetical protein [Terriglobia bacterium]